MLLLLMEAARNFSRRTANHPPVARGTPLLKVTSWYAPKELVVVLVGVDPAAEEEILVRG
jgi:hypothetical protein